ncbi:MAG: serine--tRNA ligase [Parcubacteria group bacterium CG10_big_fil_rev_8_21_14_0_10_38_31]|nr:MAG: serine--tRNA ligase [Parcubacteria group bacterium CG10_big_fil_rev_8_21_14_0_10_38_31]
MLDIKFIRENPDLVKEAARKKRIDFSVDELIKVDDKRRELISVVETARAKQNEVSDKIARLAGEEREKVIAEMKELKESLQKDEEKLKKVESEWWTLMLQVPNIPDISVPEGDSDENNQEIRKWGEIPKFEFDLKSQVELLDSLKLADFVRGAKVSGSRSYFLKNDAVLLTMALWHFAIDLLKKSGFEDVFFAPSLAREESFIGTGWLPQGKDEVYQTQDDLLLTGTSEVSMMAYHKDEVLDISELPKTYVALSPCYRREAGSYGKDTKGLVRVHEFYKLEQIVLCEANHEESVSWHEEILRNSEKIMQDLGIPYRVVVNCGGDLGLGQVKKYDIEAWIPSEGKYRETHSASYFHDFQTRRLNIRYRDKDGKIRFAHSLNNTAIATPRLLVPLLENYQQADGSVLIPEVLRQYIGKDRIS